MKSIIKLFRGVLSLGLLGGVIYGTWFAWIDYGFEPAAITFGVTAAARSLLMAWLRRREDVSQLFRTKFTRFIRSPLQEFAFMAPIYLAPAAWTQIGLWTAVAVPAAWVILRGVAAMIMRTTSGD